MGILCAAASLLPLLFVGAPAAQADVWAIHLALAPGWSPYGGSPVGATLDGGIVHLWGAITTSGTNPAAFTLPPEFRPASNVFVPVDMCHGTNGRLDIFPNGTVNVEAEPGGWGNAQCFTSLDGAWFVEAPDPWTSGGSGQIPLSLQPGWTGGPHGTAAPQMESINGIVYFSGAIATNGTNQLAFTLPVGWRPLTNVYVKVDLCGGTNGRLHIRPDGNVYVYAEGAWYTAQCLTSLDGASFDENGAAYSNPAPLGLVNGWTGGPYGTAPPEAELFGNWVVLKGAIATKGTNPVAFTLPDWALPYRNVFVPVDMCNGTNGRLDISPNGTVAVEAEGGAWGNAQCFTSLDGVSFAQEVF